MYTINLIIVILTSYVRLYGRWPLLTFTLRASAAGTQETPNLGIWGSALAHLLLMAAAKSEV